MSTETHFPSAYTKFRLKAKASHRVEAVSVLNRFAFRYRLASAFIGLEAADIGRTLPGYSVLTRVFLAYTAYEMIIRGARRLRVASVLPPDQNVIIDAPLAMRLRSNKELEDYLLSYTEHRNGLDIKLAAFFSGSVSDVSCVAFALRNIFAHGELTASPVGTNTKAKREVFWDLSDSVLNYCDQTFTECVRRL